MTRVRCRWRRCGAVAEHAQSAVGEEDLYEENAVHHNVERGGFGLDHQRWYVAMK